MEYYSDLYSKKEFNAKLTNLKYKNKKIYYIFKNPLKIIINNKASYIREYYLGDISLSGHIKCMGYDLECYILEKELEDGLEVKIKYLDNPSLCRDHLKKFSRTLEATIIGINLDEDNESELSEFNYEDEYINKISNMIYEEHDEIDNKDLHKKNNESDFFDLDDYSKFEIDKFKDNL
jgi:hypothetical protein